MRLICWNCMNWFNADLSDLKVGSPCPMCFDNEPCSSCHHKVQDDRGNCLEEYDCVSIANMSPLSLWDHNFYVNVYLVDLAKGGPEEGGWYYEVGEPIESRLCHTSEEADKVLADLNKYYNGENKGRRPISSVLSEGAYSVFLETKFAEYFPKVKPHYE